MYILRKALESEMVILLIYSQVDRSYRRIAAPRKLLLLLSIKRKACNIILNRRLKNIL